jgi:GAF domain-containing protein/HAMP domain-containing protein
MNNLKSSPSDTVNQQTEEPQGALALRTAWVMFAASVTLVILYAILAWQMQAWQMAALTGLIVAYGAGAFAGIRYIQNKRADTGLWIIIIGMYLVFPGATLLIADIGVIFALACVILTYVVSRNLPEEQSARAVYISLGAAALTVVLHFLNLSYRLTVPVLQTVIPAITALIVLVASYFFISQSWNKSSLRNKLITIMLVVALIPLAIITFLSDRSTRASLTDDANEKLRAAAISVSSELDSFILSSLDTARYQAHLPAVVNFMSMPPEKRAGSAKETNLTNFLLAASYKDPVYITSIAVLDEKGITLADTSVADIGSSHASREYFKQATSTGLPYASGVEYDQVTKSASLYFAAPITNADGKIVGVFRIRYAAAILQEILTQKAGLVGEASFAVLLDKNYIRLAHGTARELVYKSVVPLDAAKLATLQEQRLMPPGTSEELSTNIARFAKGLDNYKETPFFEAELHATGIKNIDQVAVVESNIQPWLVVFAQPQEIFLQPINAQTQASVIVALVIALGVGIFGLFVAQSLSGPIVRLTETAEEIAKGDINIQAKVESGDEIGALATTFNRMTQQLRDFIGTLESRVAERTRNLELAAEVGRTVSQVRALNVMLTDAAEIIRAQFNLYYTQVYLINPSQTALLLKAGTGHVGAELLKRNHQLVLNTNSINGRAAVERKSVVISDTAASGTFKPNPLLPDTRSEMAVPLLVGDRVVGVLDMQSIVPGSLSQDVLPAFEALAGQFAIAIQNATLLDETEQARAEVEAQARRLSRANYHDYLDAIHLPEETGYVFQNNTVTPLTVADGNAEENSSAIVAPISVTGESLGNLVVELGAASPLVKTDELVTAIARQVAEHIESLRLLETAERYRAEAEESSRRTTREGWQEYIETKKSGALGYLYNLTEVKQKDASLPDETEGVELPLKVRGEKIGNLSIHNINPGDSESIELANAVAERLSAHIENLRLSQQTMERAQREQILRQVTSAVRGSTDPEIIIRTAVRELGSIFGRNTMIQIKTQESKEPSVPGNGNQTPTVTDQVTEA